MKCGILITKTAITLAIVAVFSTVAPVLATASDTVKISNSAQSSTNTGGNTSRGADGAPGRDGADGQSISSPGQSAIHVQSSIDGELVESTYETATNETVTTKTSLTATDTVADVSAEPTATTTTLGLLKQLLQQLQVMLTSYVDIF